MTGAEFKADAELDDGVSVAGVTDVSELVPTIELVASKVDIGLAELDDGLYIVKVLVDIEADPDKVVDVCPNEDVSSAVVERGGIVDPVDAGEGEARVDDTVGV